MTDDAEHAEYYARVEKECFRPLWTRPDPPAEPLALVRPWIWRYRSAYDLLIEAGEHLGLGGEGGIDRRVLVMSNPSSPERFATRTLSGAIQLVHPGEEAPSHRHALAALRFIIGGNGGSTVVDGVPVPMEPGDLVLTPSWSWHGHAHHGTETMVWLDVLDAPLVGLLDVGFYQEFDTPKRLQPAETGSELTNISATAGDLAPTSSHGGGGRQPLLRYGFEAAMEAFARLQAEHPSPNGTYELTYTNPVDGGPVLVTIDAGMRLLTPGSRTVPHRDTANRIYHVARGSGHSIVDGERLEWDFGDSFCVPSWCTEEHGCDDQGAVLFVASDAPTKAALSLYRARAGG